MEISNVILVFKGVVSNETSKFGPFSPNDQAPRLSQNDPRLSYSASNLGNPSGWAKEMGLLGSPVSLVVCKGTSIKIWILL